MLLIDCENLKNGLCLRANRFSEKLIGKLVGDYLAENTR